MGYFTDYPMHVFLILSNEFCERFSYYGMKSILTTYFKFALGFEAHTAIALYHSFSCLCYFTPLIGAMIADGWLGKFRTILYLSMIYAVGNIVMTVTAIPINGDWIPWTPFIGLVIIAFGTGGIKPCVSSFGGDQFKPDQVRQKESFFSLFYMAINIGSLLSTIITPLVRENVKCFDQECYAVAFGIPAALMIVAIVLFAIGYRWYTKVPPGESILVRLFGCIGTAIKGKCGCCSKGPKEKKDHWLDYAEPKYDKRFIADVKDVMSVCWLFIPLPIFWALFDQQGSRWTLQAFSMKNDLGGFVMPPDMMQVMNALMVVTFVPILESLIYPCLNKLKIPNRPLQRMGVGMALSATAFLVAGLLQIAIDNESPSQVTGTSRVRFNFVNAGVCPVEVHPFMSVDGQVGPIDLSGHTNSEYYYAEHDDVLFNFTRTCTDPSGMNPDVSTQYQLKMSDMTKGFAYQGIIMESKADWYLQEINDFTLDAESSFRIFNTLGRDANFRFKQGKDIRLYNNTLTGNFSIYDTSAELEKYTLTFTDETDPVNEIGIKDSQSSFYLKNGALYTILIYEQMNGEGQPEVAGVQLTEMEPRGINIFLQVPQYAIMTLAECLFSVTGLGFAYSQAAPSMKSILTSIWLLTVAIGNVVVVVVEEAGTGMSEMVTFMVFSGLMYVTTVVFIIMAMFYKYVTPRDNWEDDTSSTSSSSSSNSSIEGGDTMKKSKEAQLFEDGVVGVVVKKLDDADENKSTSGRGSSTSRSSVRSNDSNTKF